MGQEPECESRRKRKSNRRTLAVASTGRNQQQQQARQKESRTVKLMNHSQAPAALPLSGLEYRTLPARSSSLMLPSNPKLLSTSKLPASSSSKGLLFWAGIHANNNMACSSPPLSSYGRNHIWSRFVSSIHSTQCPRQSQPSGHDNAFFLFEKHWHGRLAV